jgi:hypothetical protein
LLGTCALVTRGTGLCIVTRVEAETAALTADRCFSDRLATTDRFSIQFLPAGSLLGPLFADAVVDRLAI